MCEKQRTLNVKKGKEKEDSSLTEEREKK